MLLLTSYLISLCPDFFIFKARMVLAIALWRAVGKLELVKRFRAFRTKTGTDSLELVVYLLTVVGVWDLESPKERERDEEEVTGPGMYPKGEQNGRKL